MTYGSVPPAAYGEGVQASSSHPHPRTTRHDTTPPAQVDAGRAARRVGQREGEAGKGAGLQLCWQVAGLAVLWYVGSPQSKEGDERKEEMLKQILREVAPDKADRVIKDLEARFPTK